MRRHRQERGAAVFVVVLVVSLLMVLGLFAVKSSSLSNLSSGYNRQLVQTHYVSDYAMALMVADLSTRADVHNKHMKSGANTTCVGYALLDQPTCALYNYANLEQAIQDANPANVLLEAPALGGDVHGSLGPHNVEGDMRIEVTDWHPAWPPLAGHDVNSAIGYAMVTVSATGMVRPKQVTAGTWDTSSATAAGIEQSRAHVLIGPVQMND